MDDRHMRAVLAYCHELCEPGEAKAVAREVAAVLRSSNGDAEHELLPITQQVAAEHADVGDVDGEWRQLLEAVRQERATRAFMATLGAVAEPEVEEPITEQQAAVAPRPLEPAPRRGLVVFPAAAEEAVAAAEPVSEIPEPPVRPLRPLRPKPPSPPRLPAVSLGLLRQYRVFLTTLAAGALVVVIVALLVGGSSGSQAISLPPPSSVVGQAPQTIPSAPAPTHAKRHRHRLHHRRASLAATTTTTAPAIASATTTSHPATAPSPATQQTASNSGGVVATQQNGSLPAQTAPTQTVGSNTATTTTH